MLDTIFTRRSIRKYTGEPVCDEMIKTLLKAGMAAPSARNNQPWRFVVITERETLERISSCRSAWLPLHRAALGILVLAESEGYTASDVFMSQDCSACTENILLAAHALGLGACWLGCATPEAGAGLRALLSLPGNLVPACMIAVGHPAEERPPHTEFDMDKVVRYIK